MRLVFLTTESTHHYFLINETNKYHPVRKVFFQTRQSRSRRWLKKLKSILRPTAMRLTLRGLFRRFLFGIEQRKQEQYERKMCFGDRLPGLDSSIPSEEVFTFNTKEAADKVSKEEPDIIVVFGTEILRGGILKAARVAILNIHRDILPKYRGGGMPFWVFYNKDFENLGATVHLCTEKLDAGDILGRKFYHLSREDRIYKLRYKTTVLAAEVLRVALDNYEQGNVQYTRQEKSKLWTSRNLTLFKEIVARMNFRRYIDSL